MSETAQERALEAQRSEAIDRMKWAGELEAAIGAIRGEIARSWASPTLDDRTKAFFDSQMSLCIKVLQKKRNEYAEEAVDLWKQVGT